MGSRYLQTEPVPQATLEVLGFPFQAPFDVHGDRLRTGRGGTTMIKLRITTGLGLILFMGTLIGGPVGMSRAQAGGGGVTLASLAGNFASRGSGSFTLCFNESFTEAVDCASALHQEMHFKVTSVAHGTRDAAGNACGVTDVSSTLTGTAVEIYAAKFPTRMHVRRTNVSTTTSFDSTTRSGTASFRQYREKSCSA